MNEAYEFMKSDLGIAISWICTVASTAITLFTIKKNNALNKQIAILKINQESVTQKGKKNLYTKNVSGDMNIKM